MWDRHSCPSPLTLVLMLNYGPRPAPDRHQPLQP
jgi:hypothetical protein